MINVDRNATILFIHSQIDGHGEREMYKSKDMTGIYFAYGLEDWQASVSFLLLSTKIQICKQA